MSTTMYVILATIYVASLWGNVEITCTNGHWNLFYIPKDKDGEFIRHYSFYLY